MFKVRRSKLNIKVLISILLIYCLILHTNQTRLTIEDSTNTLENSQTTLPPDIATFKAFAYTTYSPIFIDSDDDFITHGFNGSGTYIDPYRIESLYISTTESSGIFIENITVYFTINHNYIDAEEYGIYCKNTTSNTAHINDNVVVNNNYGICLNLCDNATISDNVCSYNTDGIYSTNCENCTITDNMCSNNNRYGIYVDYGINAYIDNNTCNFTDLGILVRWSSDNFFVSNNFCSNTNGVGINVFDLDKGSLVNNYCENSRDSGIRIESCLNLSIINNSCIDNGFLIWQPQESYFSSLTIINNTVNNKELLFLYDYHDIVINQTGYYGQIILSKCSNITISNQNIVSASYGLSLHFCDLILVENNTFSDNNYGFYLYSTSNIDCSLNEFINNIHGIACAIAQNINIEKNNLQGTSVASGMNLHGVNYCNVSFNNITNFGNGMVVVSSDNMFIFNNTIMLNKFFGLEIWSTSLSVIYNNLILYNEEFGVVLYALSSSNLLHHNIFIDNNLALPETFPQAFDDGINNTWYDSITLEGNYWSNWIEGAYLIDGLGSSSDMYPLSIPLNLYEIDTDSDGMSDGWETANGLNPLVDDSSGDLDGDGLANIQEYLQGTDPNNSDSDDDGLSDGDEVNIYNTNPLILDTDADTIPDGWEVSYGLDPLVDDSSGDLDGDGLANIQEYLQGTDPNNSDSDSDGLSDGEEVNTYFTNPNSADSDSDGLFDGDEVNVYLTDPNNSDSDDDGLSDGEEVNTYFTNPNSADSDSDGLFDGDEVNIYLTDPNNSDSDDDGLTDGDEVNLYFTSPTNPDTDGDGRDDGWEVSNNQDPLSFDDYLKTYEIIIYYAILPLIALSLVTLAIVSLIRSRKRKLLLRRTMNILQGNHDTLFTKVFNDIFTNISTIFDLTSSIDRINQFTISLSDFTKDLILINSKKRSFSKDEIGIYEGVLNSTKTFLEDKFENTMLDAINLITVENLNAFSNDLLTGLARNWSEKGFEPALFSYDKLVSFLSHVKELGHNINASREILTELPSTFSSSITTLVQDKIVIVQEYSKNTEKIIEELAPIISDITINNQKLDRLSKIRDTYSSITITRLNPLLEFENEEALKIWLNIYSLEYPHRIEGDEIIFKARVEVADMKDDVVSAIDDLLDQFSNWEETGKGKKM